MKQLGLVLVAVLMICAPASPQQQKLACKIVSPPYVSRPLVKQVRPTYPAEALARGIKGPVVLQVIIDKQGKPHDIKVKKGDPVLAKAAVEAVRQWEYKPYKLNGEAVEVETMVTVNFEPSR
jgi:TonB family protein